jgi:hypothetical protein
MNYLFFMKFSFIDIRQLPNVWLKKSKNHVKWIQCHHNMKHPQVQMEVPSKVWRVAANKLNNNMCTAHKGWSSTLGLCRDLITLHKKVTL